MDGESRKVDALGACAAGGGCVASGSLRGAGDEPFSLACLSGWREEGCRCGAVGRALGP